MKSQKSDPFDRLKRLLSSFLRVDEKEIKTESRLNDDLGIDSVDFWEIVAKVEKEFKIEVREDESLAGVNTVGDVVRIIEEKMKETARGLGKEKA